MSDIFLRTSLDLHMELRPSRNASGRGFIDDLFVIPVYESSNPGLHEFANAGLKIVKFNPMIGSLFYKLDDEPVSRGWFYKILGDQRYRTAVDPVLRSQAELDIRITALCDHPFSIFSNIHVAGLEYFQQPKQSGPMRVVGGKDYDRLRNEFDSIEGNFGDFRAKHL